APSTIERYKTCLRNIYRILGDPPLGTIDDNMVRRFIKERKERRPPGQRDVAIIHDLRFLSTILSYASTQEDYRRPNWFRSWRAKDYGLIPARVKVGFLTEEQVARLYSACVHPHQRLFVVLSVECGTR